MRKDRLPRDLPLIELRHGEAICVLSRLGFQGGATQKTFYEYIKSLRKLGTPFKRRSIGYPKRALANYTYFHLMELVLVLTLRVYYVVPDSLLAEIVSHRKALNRLYRRAYVERTSGLGAPISIQTPDHSVVQLQGVYLDLRMNYAGGRLQKFGPPRLISPYDAISIFAKQDVAARAFLPINLSRLAERLVSTVLGTAPSNRRSRAHRRTRR